MRPPKPTKEQLDNVAFHEETFKDCPHSVCVVRRRAEWECMILVNKVHDAMVMIQQLPGGIDENADPMNASPEDATAHVGGLVWQELDFALKEIDR